MSQWIDEKYIGLVGSRLLHFHRQSRSTFSFRCPICGDSQKRSNKTRGYLFLYQRKYIFKCHNCNESMSLRTFLKRIDPQLYREYQLDLLRQERPADLPTPSAPGPEDDMFRFGRRSTKSLMSLPTLASLPEDHPAVRYAKGRLLPDLAFHSIHFTDRWTTWIKELGWNYAIPEDGAPRIILPWYSRSGDLLGAQARRIDVTGKDARYVTLKASEDVDKIYGVDRINSSAPVYLCEGPLDSYFLPNCCAAMGSDLLRAYDQHLKGHHTILVWDNEPRNRELLSTMEPAVKLGLPVVIWPSHIKEKDLNDMVKAGLDPEALVRAHTYKGLRATLEFLRWRKTHGV